MEPCKSSPKMELAYVQISYWRTHTIYLLCSHRHNYPENGLDFEFWSLDNPVLPAPCRPHYSRGWRVDHLTLQYFCEHWVCASGSTVIVMPRSGTPNYELGHLQYQTTRLTPVVALRNVRARQSQDVTDKATQRSLDVPDIYIRCVSICSDRKSVV